MNNKELFEANELPEGVPNTRIRKHTGRKGGVTYHPEFLCVSGVWTCVYKYLIRYVGYPRDYTYTEESSARGAIDEYIEAASPTKDEFIHYP